MDHMFMGFSLNDGQWDAVQWNENNALDEALAGTGKTRVLVLRTARLIAEGLAQPSQILMITFTRKATEEMRFRVNELLGEELGSQVNIFSFHSLASFHLRKYITTLDDGYTSRFQILAQDEAEEIIKDLRRKLVPKNIQRSFPRARALQDLFSASFNKEIPLMEMLAFNQGMDEHSDLIIKLHEQYQLAKREAYSFDYDDLLWWYWRVLQKMGTHIAQQFKFVMADEYQDTNRLQVRILEKLSSVHANCMVVGDRHQGIYLFRGADRTQMAQFNGARLPLRENYRSFQPILDAANMLWKTDLHAVRQGGEKPFCVQVQDDYMQAGYVAQEIERLHEDGVSLEDIAVLSRSIKGQTNELEFEFKRYGLEYVKYGGRKVSEGAHVKDFIAFLRIHTMALHFPAWGRVLNMLPGVGPKVVGQIIAQQRKWRDPLTGLLEWLGSDGLTKDGKRRSTYSAVDDFVECCDRIISSSVEQVAEVVEEMYYPYMQQLYEKKRGKSLEARQRDIEILVRLYSAYNGDIDKFLEDMALDPLEEDEANGKRDCLVLSTIHAFKGLERKVIFLINANEGRLPSWNALQSGDEEDVAEEGRLAYVALTRAQDMLYIIVPLFGREKALMPSRFVMQMEEALEMREVA